MDVKSLIVMKTVSVFLKTSFVIAGLIRNLLKTTHLGWGLQVKPAMMSLWLFILMVNFTWGQNPHVGSKKWSREDFIENKVSIISSYSYTVDKNGDIRGDTIFHFRYQFDAHENKLFGTELEGIYETYYNAIGQPIKYIISNEKMEDGYNIICTSIIDYEYDSLNKEIKTNDKATYNYYFKPKQSKDSMLILQVIYNEINEYVYNANNQKTECYQTIDSTRETRYFLTKRKPKTKSYCQYCRPKYLNYKWEHDSLSNLTEEFFFTIDNELYRKDNYFYDNQNRRIKLIDSTGYSRTINPVEVTITYEYTDTGKIITRIQNEERRTAIYKTIFYYDNDDKIVKECYGDSSEKNCKEYFYFYENNKLTEKIEQNILGNIIVTTYSYNEKGLLKEIQTSIDGTIFIIRYDYE